MGIITRMRKQKAVYWPCEGYNAYGQPVLGTPVEITCRWQDVTVVFKNEKGEDQTSKAQIFVDRDVVVNGRLWRGLLVDAPANPITDRTTVTIQRFEKLPNLRATEYLRTVWV